MIVEGQLIKISHGTDILLTRQHADKRCHKVVIIHVQIKQHLKEPPQAYQDY